MSLSKGIARSGLFAAVAVAVLGASLVLAATASAQNPPATYYGKATAGDAITAVIDGTTCGSATADANGEWVITVEDGGCDGKAADGATVSFTLNGTPANETETFAPGGAPTDLVNGISLTPGSGVTPPDTGNAGIGLPGGSTSPWLVGGLALFALAAVAGLRTATRRAQ